MAYLNEVKIISYLAIVPEMSLNKSGRQYCNFKVRLVYRDRFGDPVDEYLDVVAYDAMAEYLIRNCYQFDCIMVIGHLTQFKWQVKEHIHSKVVVVADDIQLVSRNKQGFSSVIASKEDLFRAHMQSYADGEHSHVSSYSMPYAPGEIVNRDTFPQPVGRDKWKMPADKSHPAIEKWANMRGVSIAGDQPVDHAEIMEKMQMPNLDPTLIEIARTLIPDDLQPDSKGNVRLPNRRAIHSSKYESMIIGQQNNLKMHRPQERNIIQQIASVCFGVVLTRPLPGHLPTPITESKEYQDKMNAEQRQAQQMAEQEERQRNRQHENRVIAAGANPEDWYKDDNGNWHKKTK